MEKSLTRYIWTHTKPAQLWVLGIVLLSMIPYYLAFDLPKQIVNGPIQGDGFETPDAQQLFMQWVVDLPYVDRFEVFPGINLDRMDTLVALSLTFLALVIVNGMFKLYINTYKGRLGERLLRRIRYELVDRLLRFPPTQFRRLKPAEAASMIKDEVEPLGGFTGDAFVQPVMLGGQAIAALAFIFVQNLWLGALAGAIAAFQVAIIPRMRRRLIRLGRERQLTARQLSGRVNEIMDGIVTVHALDTSNYERADLVRRLGKIFRIRYELYQWKFMVKFLNNFLSQITPFIFYLLGGWMTIRGTLDVGQLVAVINAYKELPGPLKELIDWDQARQDVEVKYEQVVEQFRVDELVDPQVQAVCVRTDDLPGVIAAMDLVLRDDSGNVVLDHATITIGHGELVALVDDMGIGAEMFASALGRAMWPSGGRLCVGNTNLLDLPESIAGRRISYVPAEGYFFQASLLDNLLYGLRHAPIEQIERTGADLRKFRWAMDEARAAGNPQLDAAVSWIDKDSVVLNAQGRPDLGDAIMTALTTTEMMEDVLDLGLSSRFDPLEKPDLATRIVEIRHALWADGGGDKVRTHVVPFERDQFNAEATIAENLLFGTLEQPLDQMPRILQSPEVRAILARTGLTERLYDLGFEMAGTLLELLGDDPVQESMLEDLPYLTPENVPDLRAVLVRCAGLRADQVGVNDRIALVRMAMFYVEPKRRFGLMTPDLADTIVRARADIQAEMQPTLRAMIDPYDPMRYMRSATLMENILFGKVRGNSARAGQALRDVVLKTLQGADLTRRVIQLGLGVDIGVSGRRLSIAQRQKLNIARVIIRRSEYYIFNKSLSGIDGRVQERILNSVVGTIRDRGGRPSIIWVLANTRLADHFDRVAVFDRGRIIADGDVSQVSEMTRGSGLSLGQGG